MFDSRGIGNTTMGSKPYTMQLLANDTAGLMDASKIPKAAVMGYSLGGEAAQQFAVSYPEKVDSLVLVSTSCGGKDSIPKPLEFKKSMTGMINQSLNNVPISHAQLQALTVASLGSGWIKLHPKSANIPENMTFSQMKPSLSLNAMKNQADAGFAWEATNWNGVCDQLAKISKPTSVITGTDDNNFMPHANALVIAGKIPGA